MNTTLKIALDKTITYDSVLRDFSIEALPESSKLRVAELLHNGFLEKYLDGNELNELEAWADEETTLKHSIRFDEIPLSIYYVMSKDNSLYWTTNGYSEVWADANEFAMHTIVNGYNGPLDKNDVALLRYLGDSFADVINERSS